MGFRFYHGGGDLVIGRSEVAGSLVSWMAGVSKKGKS